MMHTSSEAGRERPPDPRRSPVGGTKERRGARATRGWGTRPRALSRVESL